MGLVFSDSFDHYATANITQKWTSGAGGGTINSGGCFHARVLDAALWVRHLGLPDPSARSGRVIVGSAVYPNNLPCKALYLLHTGGYSIIIGIDTDLSVTYWAYFGFDAPGGKSAPNVCQQNGYNYIEADVTFSLTVGSVTIRVNGVQVFTVSGINTANVTSCNGLLLGGAGGLAGTRHDDVYVVDPSTSPNSGFLGAVRIYAEVPDLDKTPLDWTPSVAGDHYPLVNSIPPDLTKWVQSNTVGQIDQYEHPVAGIPVSSAVVAVQHCLLAQLDSAGSRSIASSVNDIPGLGVALSTSPLVVCTPYDVDPVTGLTWILTDIPTRRIGETVTA